MGNIQNGKEILMKTFFSRLQMKYQNVDKLLQDVQCLLKQSCEKQDYRNVLPSPILFELANPMARFSCLLDMREFAARTAAESLYLLSGMNGSDFIWEFRGWKDPRIQFTDDPFALGPKLRFQNLKTGSILDYNRSNAFRQVGTGYTDQLKQAVERLKRNNILEQNAIIQFASTDHPVSVHSVWFHTENNKLEMLVSAGYVEGSEELWREIVPPFAFLHQIVSELTEIQMGSSRFMIGGLFSTDNFHELKFAQSRSMPIVNMHDFKYPNGKISLQDVDTLMSIMVEFVSRLDGNSLGRANPFEGDDRVQMWSDYAEVFRAWKAEKLGYKIMMEQNFHHPQLRFIYKGETV